MDEQDMREAGVILISSEVRNIPRPHIDLTTSTHPLTTINKSKREMTIYKPEPTQSSLLKKRIPHTNLTLGSVGLTFIALASAAGIGYTSIKKKQNKAKLNLLSR
jgi:hypothetical protein